MAMPRIKGFHEFIWDKFSGNSLLHSGQVTQEFKALLPGSTRRGAGIAFCQLDKFFFQFLRARHRIHRRHKDTQEPHEGEKGVEEETYAYL